MAKDGKSRGGGRVSALMHTNVFSLGDIIGTLRGGSRWWPTVIDDASLPEPADNRVRAIVTKTRLWNAERCEVARELCNHAREAIDAGRSPEEIAKGLGDPKPIARLIRRSMKRKRPITWQARAWAVRGLGIAACVVVLVAGFMTVRFFVGKPTISRNIVAELNAPIRELDEDEKAWPLLREAWSTVGPKQYIAREAMDERARAYHDAHFYTDRESENYIEQHAEAGIDLITDFPEGHPDADAVMALYESIRPELEMMHEAASRPRMGMLYSTKYTEIPEEIAGTPEAYGWLSDPIPDDDNPANQEWVVSILLPGLGPTRWFAKWFAFEAKHRVAQGDSDGAIESIDAMLGLTDLVANDNFLIGYLVGIAIESIAVGTVSDILTEHGDTLTDDHLRHLAHAFGAPRLNAIPLDGEQLMFDDFIQRSFTDDGSGDGYLTNEGLEMIRMLESLSAHISDGIVENASFAVQIARVGSRADQQRTAEAMYNQLRHEEAAGYGIYRDTALASDAMIEMLDGDRYLPLRLLLPAVSRVLTNKLERRARVEALLVAIASELYRRDSGAWPASVTDLHPRYLPFIPEDPSTGDPITIAPGEHAMTVYALGPDRDDDGGHMDPDRERDMRPRTLSTFVEMPGRRIFTVPLGEPTEDTPDGDWVLFPTQ